MEEKERGDTQSLIQEPKSSETANLPNVYSLCRYIYHDSTDFMLGSYSNIMTYCISLYT